MAKYIENVNAYLTQMKIKQTYVSAKSGIERNKLSRILTGAQEASVTDMEKIAKVLGRKPEFFLSEEFALPKELSSSSAEVAFYAGEPTESQVEFAKKVVELIENADVVLGARGRFRMQVGE